MRILAIDIGTGTQDILLFDTSREPENCFKLIMPSPTIIVAQRIRRATARGAALLLTGVTMGGGPCARAAHAHLKAGYPIYATPDAARTFDDDLDKVSQMGVQVLSQAQAAELQDVESITMQDFDAQAIWQALAAFDINIDFDALAIAVFDHGNAPPGYSDRKFRFNYLAQRLQTRNHLASFAFWRDEIPPSMTRLLAVAQTAPVDTPLYVMDTAPAAVLGALEDPRAAGPGRRVVVNVGNGHTLAFRLNNDRIEGLFEHHTGRLTPGKLEELLTQLAAGTLDDDQIFADHGHGALMFDCQPRPLDSLAITGPKRGLLKSSRYRPYMAVPYGDMMLAGCWGMVRAMAKSWPERQTEIETALQAGS